MHTGKELEPILTELELMPEGAILSDIYQLGKSALSELPLLSE